MRAPLRELDDWKLSDGDKDIRGWTLRSTDGKPMGRVSDLIGNTDTQAVEAVVLENGQEYPVSKLELGDGEVQLIADGARRSSGTTEPRRGDQEIRIPIVEERIEVGKRETVRGGVRVESRVREESVSENVTLRTTEVHVERIAADRLATEQDLKNAGRNVDVLETAEEPVVRKTARVVGEVVVSKDVTEDQKTIDETVRKTDVKVHDVDKERNPERPSR